MFRKQIAAVLGTTALLASAVVAGTTPSAHADTWDTMDMVDAIDGELSGNVVGYAFSIAKNGQVVYSNGHGKARNNADGNVPMGGRTRLDIMSATKNFTAISILDLLEREHLTPAAKVSPYLPPAWSSHPSWKEVTFQQLLSHTSGLGQQPVDADFTEAEKDQWGTLNKGVKFAMSQPLVVGSDYDYTNMNYATLRIALVGLWKTVQPGTTGWATVQNSGDVAMRYLNARFLIPMGIAAAACGPANPDTAAKAYDIFNKSEPGAANMLLGEDLQACAGHRGLWLSPVDMTQFLSNVQNLKGVSATVRNWQNDLELGWQRNAGSGASWHGGDRVGTYQVHTCVARFPGNVQASIIMNSGNLTGRSACRVLIDSYLKGAGVL